MSLGWDRVAGCSPRRVFGVDTRCPADRRVGAPVGTVVWADDIESVVRRDGRGLRCRSGRSG